MKKIWKFQHFYGVIDNMRRIVEAIRTFNARPDAFTSYVLVRQVEPVKPVLPTEIEVVADHKFEVANFHSVRLMRFLSPSGLNFVGNEPRASEFADMTPEQIAQSRRCGCSDGYYEFTKIQGELIVDSTRPEFFSREVGQSPITYIRGEEVELASLLNDDGWKEAAGRQMKAGYKRAVLVPWGKDRPFRPLLYPLNSQDRVIKIERLEESA